MKSKDHWTEAGKIRRRNWLLVLLFFLGLGLRLHGFNWGLPHHFHPDERQIVDFQAPKVRLDILNPKKSLPLLVKGDWKQLDTMLSGMNTKFFAYGPLPMYTLVIAVETQDWINNHVRSFSANQSWISLETHLKINNWFPPLKDGRGRIIMGRILAALFSAFTILIVFRLGKYMYNVKIGYLAAAFFTFTVLSIQQAHFMIVDGPQTFLVACAMYYLVRIAMGDRRRDYYLSGIFIGLAMATKFSTSPIALSYILAQLLSMTLGRRRDKAYWIHWIAGGITALVVMTIVMPFWILDSQTFFRDITAQSNMVTGIADLPYTIQFEHTMPIVYMLQNLVLWSLGLPLGLAALIGLIAAIRRIWKNPEDLGNIVILSFILPLMYFNGTFFAKFLRYTLVTIPFLTLFAARLLLTMKSWAGRRWERIATLAVMIGTILWATAFQTIYLKPHTRIQASDWIYENIPAGKNIVLESSWDDSVPVSTEKGTPRIYSSKQMGVYKEPDNQLRAKAMAEILEWGDVVVLASRRHYGSVTRVPNRYPVSTNFYKLLFNEKLGYQHVKTFDNPPALGRLKFRDDLADESFRVYEHPRVDIFVKESGISASGIEALLMAPPSDVVDMSYTELLTRRPATELGSHVNYPIIKWLLAIYILGFICIPFAYVIFSKFEHKGYPFTKLMGLLIVGYFSWLIPSAQWLPFSRTLIIAVMILLGWAAYVTFTKHYTGIAKFVRERCWSIAGYEILFLIIFCLFGLLKSYNPNIYWSESSMDFGFLNAVLRAEYFPPEDPWIQGQGINYYYYGHYLAGFLTKLTGIEAHYGYNLFFITIPSLVALSVAAILLALTRRVWVALIGVVFSILIGNLDGLPQMANIWVRNSRGTNTYRFATFFQTIIGQVFNLGRQDNHFRFFRSAHELIRPTVHEFPFWSYNFMDLHAHTLATMLTVFFLALQLVLLRNEKNGINLFGDTKTGRAMTLGILWITFGAMISTNSWDIPIQVILMLLISLWVMVYVSRHPTYSIKTQRIPSAPYLDTHAQSEDSLSTEKQIDQSEQIQSGDDLTVTFSEMSVSEPDSSELLDSDTRIINIEDLSDPEQENEIEPQIKGIDQQTESVNQSSNMADQVFKSVNKETEAHTFEEIESKEVSLNDGDSDNTELSKPFLDRLITWVDNGIKWVATEIFLTLSFLWKLLWPLAAVIVGGVVLHLPFLNTFHRAGMGIGTLWKYRQTTNLDGFLTMFGFFIFIFITQFILWWWKIQKDKGRSTVQILFILVAVVTILALVWYGLLTIPTRSIDHAVLLISIFIIYLLGSIILEGQPDANEVFPLLLALGAVGITAGCELVFIKDFYHGSDMRRFNTIFKFYMQAWFMFALVSAYLMARRSRIRHRAYKKASTKFFVQLGSWGWSIVFLFLFGGSLIFTFWGVYARHHNGDFQQGFNFPPGSRSQLKELPLTLDGWAYMKKGYRPVSEYRAIDWLQKHVKGTPVILEASGADYLYQYGNISGNTGLPTVLGWWSHVDQREYLVRKARGKGERDRPIDTGKIKRDIVTMYSSVDIPKVLSLLGQYRVRYIFVGPTEKAEYESLGLEKFKEMTTFLTPVYSNSEVVIYEVHDYGQSVDLATAIQDNTALKRLQQEMAEREEQERLKKIEAEQEQQRRIINMPARTLFKGSKGIGRGMYEEPRSQSVAPDGSIYIADFRNHRIQKFNAEGEWQLMWGSTGNMPGQFNDICDVAANSQYVYVLDTFNNRIQMYSHQGSFIRLIVPGDYSISHPRGIAADEDYIFLSDTGNSRIIRMNASGADPMLIGKSGKGQLQFGHPVGIDIKGDEVFIVDTQNQRIQVISKDGAYLREFPVEGWVAEVYNEPYVVVASDGTLYYSDPSKGQVTQIDQDGKILKRIRNSIDGNSLSLPMGLGIMPNGDVFVVDAGNHAVVKIFSQHEE